MKKEIKTKTDQSNRGEEKMERGMTYDEQADAEYKSGKWDPRTEDCGGFRPGHASPELLAKLAELARGDRAVEHDHCSYSIYGETACGEACYRVYVVDSGGVRRYTIVVYIRDGLMPSDGDGTLEWMVDEV
jgi:hypothetical protein